MRLIALRGATSVTENDAAAILDATEELMHEILGRNTLSTENLVSCIFTLTPDLDAEFPALAARKLGFQEVPLLCCREIPVPTAMPRVVRLMMHVETELTRPQVQHVYLRGAAALRLDIAQ